VYARQKHRCAVPFCERGIFLDRAHIVAHARGGSREIECLIVLCTYHHLLLDSGKLRLEGTAENPRFYDEQGRDLARRLEAPAVSRALARRPGAGLDARAEPPPPRAEEIPGYVAMFGSWKRVAASDARAQPDERGAERAGDERTGGCDAVEGGQGEKRPSPRRPGQDAQGDEPSGPHRDPQRRNDECRDACRDARRDDVRPGTARPARPADSRQEEAARRADRDLAGGREPP
jgi:hypothetical protein